MISALHINGLKSIDNLEINLRKLNLLTGINSAGKSSVIQAILLLIQNLSTEKGSPLNGHLVSLGDFREVRNHNTKAEEIKNGSTSRSIILKTVPTVSLAWTEERTRCPVNDACVLI